MQITELGTRTCLGHTPAACIESTHEARTMSLRNNIVQQGDDADVAAAAAFLAL